MSESQHIIDDRVLQSIAEDNLPLVRSIASRFTGRGVEHDELCQIGFIGLMQAVKGYDESIGTSLSSYAFRFIEGEIRKFLRENTNIHMSKTAIAIAKQAMELIDVTIKERGEQVSIAEIATELNTTPIDVIYAMNAYTGCVSLDQIIDEDERRISIIESDLSASQEKYIMNRIEIKEMMQCLEDTERRIISLRYIKDLTQERVGKLLNLSQSQVSKLEKIAIQKMRIYANNGD